LLLVPLLGAWILVAAICAVLLGRSVRVAEQRRKPAVPVVLREPPEPASAEERGFVQICLFDASALRA
jgi:hypothetical protein